MNEEVHMLGCVMDKRPKTEPCICCVKFKPSKPDLVSNIWNRNKTLLLNPFYHNKRTLCEMKPDHRW